MQKISVALAVFNEEKNLERCLKSVIDFAHEIVIVDGSSTDKTVEIAKKFKAKIEVCDNPPMFHINKQKAIDRCTGDWILQLDADEVVSRELGEELKLISNLVDKEIEEYQESIKNIVMLRRHQAILDKREGEIGDKTKNYAAFFIPRANFFLGRYLKYGGVYPDGVIRFFKKGKAYLPCRDVHEQFVVDGRVGWLQNDLLHFDSPTFEKYITRNNRYTTFIASQYREEKLPKNPVTFIKYIFFLPIKWFLLTFFRHKGFLDSWQGFVFSFFSSLRFAISYIKYIS